uniref:Uncharacterized protein n=1 Tax=Molossus molossus TaxID=27622 RepID=A0A7J8JVW1_MOLMO|nr:hypothetical protein HJG59_008033 [Molossus molossus]
MEAFHKGQRGVGGQPARPFVLLVGKKDPCLLVLRDEATRQKARGRAGSATPFISDALLELGALYLPSHPALDLWPVKFNHMKAFHLTYEYPIFHAFVLQDCQNPANAGTCDPWFSLVLRNTEFISFE